LVPLYPTAVWVGHYEVEGKHPVEFSAALPIDPSTTATDAVDAEDY